MLYDWDKWILKVRFAYSLFLFSSTYSQIVSLENEVETANALAQQREEDNSLEELISTGLQEMSENQNVVETLLIEIIGKQNQTLEAVEEATRTIQTLEELTLKSLEAQNAIQVALREQMNAIKIAYSQNLITLDQVAHRMRCRLKCCQGF